MIPVVSELARPDAAAFEWVAKEGLDQFVLLSRGGNYGAAYGVWSGLTFEFLSLCLELGAERVGVAKRFQEQIRLHPELLDIFLHNGEAMQYLTPQERLFTEAILKEYQGIYSERAEKIAEVLEELSLEKRESFAYAQGAFLPLDPSGIEELKVLSANIICFPGTLTYVCGGICPWKMRMGALIEKIRGVGAEIVCLQEVWDPEAMQALVEGLKEDYAFFVYNAGDPAGTIDVRKMGYGSGLFIASRLPLDKVEFFRFPRSLPEGSNRGALIATCRVADRHFVCMNTHLQHGKTEEMQAVRKEQLGLCYEKLKDVEFGCLVGDLNIDGFSEELEESGLKNLFVVEGPSPTCTDYFNDLVLTPIEERGEVPLTFEWLDYCVSVEGGEAVRELVPLFDTAWPAEALSDHQGLLTTWKLR